MQYSDAISKKSESGSDDIFDTSKTEKELEIERQFSKSLEGSPMVDTRSNESDTNTFEHTYNIMSSVPSTESINMTSSNLSPGNQFSNITELEPKARLTIQEKLSKEIIPNVKIITLPTYKVTVKFDSITVNDGHEGALSGDAEYDLSAYVQGLKIGLTDKSHRGSLCAGCDIPPHGLGDVSEGETVTFDPGTEVTVEIPETLPLSIFTVGEEVDRCGRGNHPDNEYDRLITILQKPQDTWFDSIKAIQQNINTHGCGSDPHNVFINHNEVLGTITKFYFPPGSSYEPIGYGAGAHTKVPSDTGDFILRYTISVTPPTTPVEKHIDSNKLSNKFETNNTFTFNKLD